MLKTNIGIDISPDAIRLIEFKKALFGSHILNYGIKVLPHNANNDDITKALNELLIETPLHDSMVKISLSGSNIRTQFATLPELPKEELISLVKNHFDKLVPFPPDECIVDLNIINKEIDNNINVLIVSSYKPYVEERIEILKRVQLTPNMICIDALAMHKLFLESDLYNKHKNFLLINTTEELCTILMIKKGHPIFIKDIDDKLNPMDLSNRIFHYIESAQQSNAINEIDSVILTGDIDKIVALEHPLCSKHNHSIYRWNAFTKFKFNNGIELSERKAYSLALALAIANA